MGYAHSLWMNYSSKRTHRSIISLERDDHSFSTWQPSFYFTSYCPLDLCYK